MESVRNKVLGLVANLSWAQALLEYLFTTLHRLIGRHIRTSTTSHPRMCEDLKAGERMMTGKKKLATKEHRSFHPPRRPRARTIPTLLVQRRVRDLLRRVRIDAIEHLVDLRPRVGATSSTNQVLHSLVAMRLTTSITLPRCLEARLSAPRIET